MEEGTLGSRRTRSQVAPDWTVKDCLILVNEIAAVDADCSNAFSTFQKWTMISENCNALDVHRNLNQCRRKWDSLVSHYNQIKQWESQSRRSYRSLSTENKKKLNLPGKMDNELLIAIDAVVMSQEDKAGTEPDSDPEAQDFVDVTTELDFAGSKRSRQRTTPWGNRVQENIREKPAKATHKNKTMEEIEEDVEAMEAKLSYKIDLIHAIVGRSVSKDNETGDGIGIDNKLKFVRQQGDELIVCLSEIVSTLDRIREVPQEI